MPARFPDIRSRAARACLIAAAAAAAVLGSPSPASAHGVDEGAKSILDFIWLGMSHMLLGWDHLLFIIGVVLLAGVAGRAAAFVSLFALGHSITLIVATVAQWRISASAVDIVIALSLVFVGAVAAFAKPKTSTQWRLFGGGVFLFGLIHGLGLSTRLQDIEVTALSRIIAFNVGIEIGQLLAIFAVLVAASFLPARRTTEAAQVWAGTALAVVGIVAAGVLTVIHFDRDDSPADATAAAGPCRTGPRTERLPSDGGHPAKKFYEPNENTPYSDFGHVLGDGFLIVQYQPVLPADQVTQLREFVTGPNGVRVLAGPALGQVEPVKAFNRYDALICATFDLPSLQQFTRKWFDDPRSRTA